MDLALTIEICPEHAMVILLTVIVIIQEEILIELIR